MIETLFVKLFYLLSWAVLVSLGYLFCCRLTLKIELFSDWMQDYFPIVMIGGLLGGLTCSMLVVLSWTGFCIFNLFTLIVLLTILTLCLIMFLMAVNFGIGLVNAILGNSGR